LSRAAALRSKVASSKSHLGEAVRLSSSCCGTSTWKERISMAASTFVLMTTFLLTQ